MGHEPLFAEVTLGAYMGHKLGLCFLPIQRRLSCDMRKPLVCKTRLGLVYKTCACFYVETVFLIACVCGRGMGCPNSVKMGGRASI